MHSALLKFFFYWCKTHFIALRALTDGPILILLFVLLIVLLEIVNVTFLVMQLCGLPSWGTGYVNISGQYNHKYYLLPEYDINDILCSVWLNIAVLHLWAWPSFELGHSFLSLAEVGRACVTSSSTPVFIQIMDHSRCLYRQALRCYFYIFWKRTNRVIPTVYTLIK